MTALKSYASDEFEKPDVDDLSTPGSRPKYSRESGYVLLDQTREGLNQYLRYTMRIFNERFSIEMNDFEEDVELVEPSSDLVFRYCKYVVVNSKMEKEIPIMCLIYVERLLTKTGILLNNSNWRRLSLIALCVASKIWDDDSLENQHFPKVMKDVTLKEINELERVFLDLLGYDLMIRGAEYAKYYFILRTLAEKHQVEFKLRPLTVENMYELQHSTSKAEFILKEKHKKVGDLKHSL